MYCIVMYVWFGTMDISDVRNLQLNIECFGTGVWATEVVSGLSVACSNYSRVFLLADLSQYEKEARN